MRRRCGWIRAQTFVGVVAAGFVACADGDRARPGSVVSRDSAGVEIAEIQGDPWSAPVWATLDTANAIRITPDDSRPETLFGRVRGALRLSDGRIAVLDAGRHSVALFAANGALIRMIGRQGQGPGELDQPWRLIRGPADTLAIYDMSGHLELLPESGEGSRRVRLPWESEVGTAQVLGAFAGGEYLAIMNEFPGKPRPGSNPLFSALHVMTAAGTPGPALGRHQSTAFTFRAGPDGKLRQVSTLFWAEPGMATLPSGYAWCLSTTFDCEIWSNTGRRVRSIRASVATDAVDDAKVQELAASQLARASSRAESTRVRGDIMEGDRMERLPVLSLIRSDVAGRIWMRPYVWRAGDTTARWLVFEATGQVLGTVLMPAGFQVFDIGSDYVLGVERDADDAEEIVMYPYKVR